MDKWSLEFFRSLGASEVVVNDRAPARHADEAAGARQRSVPVNLAAYLKYVQARSQATCASACPAHMRTIQN